MGGKCSVPAVAAGAASRRRQLRDRSHDLPAMSDDRYAEILQIVRRQFPKNVVVNLIVAKGGFVLSEADASQPLAHIHGQVLAIVRRSPYLAISGQGSNLARQPAKMRMPVLRGICVLQRPRGCI